VTAIEKDPLNVFIASLNLRSLGLDNVELIEGDCLDPEIVQRIPRGTLVFSDPARPAGSPERRMDELVPDPRAVMEAYAGKAPGFCFEVPPYLARERIGIECEAEYVSIDARLNRLNLYTGVLRRTAVSAVVLPSGYAISGDTAVPAPVMQAWEGLPIAQEADPAVVESGLLGLALEGERVHALSLDERRTLVFSDEGLKNGSLSPPMRVLSICDEGMLIDELRRVGAGKVTIRYRIDPGSYWARRNDLERPLTGTKKVLLFKGERYVILESLSRSR
jgi:hypothetical protein